MLAGVEALVAIGVCGPGLIDAALPFHPRAGIRRGLVVFLGLCVGISLWGAIGLAGFFMRRTSLPELMAGDALLTAVTGTAIVVWRRTRKPSVATIHVDPLERVSRSMLFLLLLAIAGSAAIFALQIHQRPDGGYDAWAIWNVRARFIFARSPHTFDATFPHADYSPLWPALLARIAWLMGGLSTTLPIICAATAAVLNAGILFLGAAWFRGPRAGVLAAIVLLGTQEFVVHAADQYADVPLACVFLSAGVLLAIFLDSQSSGRVHLAVLSGMLAGVGALVKNEGIIYLIGLFAGLIVAMLKFLRPRAVIGIGAFAAGALPMLLLLGVFKIAFAPANDLISGGAAFAVAHDVDSLPLSNGHADAPGAASGTESQAPPTLLRRLTDIHRYRTVLFSVLNRLVRIDRWNIFLLAAVISFVVPPRTTCDLPGRMALRIAILITCVGYFFAYITTPHGLEWHIETSMNRLILQIWGPLVFLIAMRLTDAPHPQVVSTIRANSPL